MLEVRKWDGFSDPIPNEKEYSAVIGGLVDCSQTCEQKINALIANANLQQDKWVTLTKIGTNKLRVTGPVGVNFEVYGSGCFTSQETVQDFCAPFGTCVDFKKLGATLSCGCDNSDTTAFKVVGIEYQDLKKVANFGEFAGLKAGDNASVLVRKVAWVVFQNSVNDTQYTALVNALSSTGNEYLDIFGSATAINACSALVTTSSTSA